MKEFYNSEIKYCCVINQRTHMEKSEWCTKRDIKEITEVLAGVPGSADVNSWALQCKSGLTSFSKRVTHLQCMWLYWSERILRALPSFHCLCKLYVLSACRSTATTRFQFSYCTNAWSDAWPCCWVEQTLKSPHTDHRMSSSKLHFVLVVLNNLQNAQNKMHAEPFKNYSALIFEIFIPWGAGL